MTISKIVIQNIRGFDDTTLDVQFLPNKPNIFIAPNGFGKSTLSTAFNCARGAKLLVDEKTSIGNKKYGFHCSRFVMRENG
ncbi:AAA family ATPase [Ochrobactrum grignonense]|nr:AAA family ATPase [Brucella grignonensis]